MTAVSLSKTQLEAPQGRDTANTSPNPLSRSRKRQKCHHESELTAGNLFCLLPSTASPSSAFQPLFARPVGLIARSRLPLACLGPPQSLSSAGRLFRSHQSLPCRAQNETGDHVESRVLLTGIDGHPGLYAVESIKDHVYCISEMARGLDMAAIHGLPAVKPGVLQRPTERAVSYETLPRDWWTDLALPVSSHSDRLRLDGDIVGCFEPAAITEKPSQTPDLPNESKSTEIATGAPLSETPDVALRNLVMHYLNFLYISKASHAYFAKAPLARLRGAFRNTEDMLGLVQALRDMILTSTCLNKKYKTVIPDLVKASPLETPAFDSLKDPRGSRLPILKKPKPNREGLYSLEEDCILQWWSNGQTSFPSSAMLSLPKAAQQLRFRETLLQIILILEVITLESQFEHRSHDLDGQAAPKEPGPFVHRTSRKKPQDLELLLDVHVDSLCIYQSLQDLNIKETDTIQNSVEGGVFLSDHNADIDASKDIQDELKEFYTAVAIPFYSAKIPKIIEMLGWKTGAHTGGKAAQRGKAVKGSRKPMPGTEVKRIWPRRALESPRDHIGEFSEASGTRLAAGLLRSATDSSSHFLERKKSMTPQGASFLGDSHRSLSRANSVTQSTRGRTREVDMGAIHRFNESRQKKTLSIETELKAAIATLKKPNRGLAVKDYIEAADERKASQSAPKSVVKKQGPAVQIGSTPKRTARTTSGLLAATPQRIVTGIPSVSKMTSALNSLGADPGTQPGAIEHLTNTRGQQSGPIITSQTHGHHKAYADTGVSSTNELVPQSSFKSLQSGSEPNCVVKRPPSTSRIRPESTTPASNKIGSYKVDVAATPTKPSVQAAGQEMPKITHVMATPTKARLVTSALSIAHGHPTSSREQSVYAKLGWVDDDIEGTL